MSKPNTQTGQIEDDTACGSLADAWCEQAQSWLRWARKPGHDSYWQHHRDHFLEIVPQPGKLTVDIGCGEGRLTRDLKKLGHKVIAVDISEELIQAARQEDPDGTYIVACASQIPLDDAVADLAIAFMSPQDIDDLDSAVREMSRLLVDGGRVTMAIVHPLNSAGQFATLDPQSEFIIRGSYLEDFRTLDVISRDGLEMVFHSQHRSLERYSRAFERAGLLIELIRENPVPDGAVVRASTKRWQRLPLFLHIRAVKPGRWWRPCY